MSMIRGREQWISLVLATLAVIATLLMGALLWLRISAKG